MNNIHKFNGLSVFLCFLVIGDKVPTIGASFRSSVPFGELFVGESTKSQMGTANSSKISFLKY